MPGPEALKQIVILSSVHTRSLNSKHTLTTFWKNNFANIKRIAKDCKAWRSWTSETRYDKSRNKTVFSIIYIFFIMISKHLFIQFLSESVSTVGTVHVYPRPLLRSGAALAQYPQEK